FKGFKKLPAISVLRSFSAPVSLKTDLSKEQLAELIALDTDSVNRYESARELVIDEIKSIYLKNAAGPSEIIIRAYQKLISDPSTDPMLKSEIMTLPGVDTICSELPHHDAVGVYHARELFLNRLASALRSELDHVWQHRQAVPYRPEPDQMSDRAFTNACLTYLTRASREVYEEQAFNHFIKADNMTNRIAAYGILCRYAGPLCEKATQQYRDRFGQDQLAMDKWFAVQMGMSQVPDLNLVQKLASDSLFDLKNPNRVRALLGSFARNVITFHLKDGSGYEYLAKHLIEIDRFNPSIAARLATLFDKTQKLLPEAKARSVEILTRVIRQNSPSNDLSEIINKVLQCDQTK
ncbi:MAG: aminopeptidase N C-terminal domain-containing protein, partial [Candidatus Omnitrophica bacterium]|nr:aminopeptidase N C-terminal domain-containing protein [Candidatus Omnitrophota bacterium]